MGTDPHPINIKGYGRLRRIQSNISNTFILFTFFFALIFSNPMCCSSVVSMAWGGALAGLSRLGQSNVHLPWRGPSRVSVHWTFVGLPDETGLTDLRNRSDRISWRRCKEPSTRCTWRTRVMARFCVNSEHWVHHVSLQGNCRMQINQTSWPWILGETSNKNSTASSIGTAGSCFLSSS